MKVVIAGGTGALGRRIAADLSQADNEIVVLTRSPRDGFPFRQVTWDGRSVGPWASELDDAVVINLAGELVDKRPTPRNIELLKSSRVAATRALVEASQGRPRPVPFWLQASTTAIYGDAGDAVITEDSPIPDGPPQMPGVARPWEEAAKDANASRQVIFRMSLVLDRARRCSTGFRRLSALGSGVGSPAVVNG